MASYNKEQAAGDVYWNNIAIAIYIFSLKIVGAMY